ncbi:N-acetyltransferase [Vitiosangium sp. GDMCC 1.1324]|uniref:GNAT family N-acetyltransferase n=1 Tax=Vitiosangium sp. (strain GDMCC 1.1324) TaxID=2138576 RepID=UPI000D3D465D|nr:GNAT family N-acetyltransferase [Vitiosangium sp. GDMCC 1.1324]PTL75851.1 GNAT family N-acetyltransferase [Vitiosangium sp. GDMCC 1.1324]
MAAPEFSSALFLPLDRLAEGFAACFAGYVVPISADVRAFEQRLRTEHVHLADSHVMVREGRVVALGLVARRGDVSRVAAMGIVPELRRSGVGHALLQRIFDDARSRGDRSVGLEVIESNAPAVALYERTGFQVRRRLVGWEGTLPEHSAPLEEVPLTTAVAAVLREGEPGLPWQLAPETLAGLTAPTRAFRLGSAVAVITEAGPQDVVLRSLVVAREKRRQGEGSRLVRGLAARLPGRRWKVPAISPEELGAPFFTAMGLRRQALTQLEMVHGLQEGESSSRT